MICRLCLRNIYKEIAVELYESNGNMLETQLIKMITKYLQLELTEDDAVSTCLCRECCENLENFHQFCLLVEEKQNTLRNNEFLEIKCNIETQNVNGNLEAVQQFYEYNEEPLLDIKNVLIREQSDVEIDRIKPVEIDSIALGTVHGENRTLNGISIDSDDDDTPLQQLCNKLKSKTTTTTRITLKSKQNRHKKLKTRKTHKFKTDDMPKKANTDKWHTMKRNYEIITDFMPLVCDLCNVNVQNYTDLREHFNDKHQRNAYLRCCNLLFHKPSKLVEHINWHRNPNISKCDICNKQLRSSNYVQMHKALKHGVQERNELQCEICKKSFLVRKCLENHLRRHAVQEAKSYNCKMCEKSFINAQRLRRHVESIHEDLHPHVCDICGTKFKFKPSFERHLLLHQGVVEPPAQCKVCKKWLKNKNALRIHGFNHDMNATCQICGRVCPSRTALWGHISYAHKHLKSLQCNYCDKSFKMEKSLQEHIAMHTGIYLYTCTHCAKGFRSKSNMYAHVKRAHKAEWLQSKLERSLDPNDKVVVEDKSSNCSLTNSEML